MNEEKKISYGEFTNILANFCKERNVSYKIKHEIIDEKKDWITLDLFYPDEPDKSYNTNFMFINGYKDNYTKEEIEYELSRIYDLLKRDRDLSNYISDFEKDFPLAKELKVGLVIDNCWRLDGIKIKVSIEILVTYLSFLKNKSNYLKYRDYCVDLCRKIPRIDRKTTIEVVTYQYWENEYLEKLEKERQESELSNKIDKLVRNDLLDFMSECECS